MNTFGPMGLGDVRTFRSCEDTVLIGWLSRWAAAKLYRLYNMICTWSYHSIMYGKLFPIVLQTMLTMGNIAVV